METNKRSAKYYIPYVRHCIRFFFSNQKLHYFDNPVSENDWTSVRDTYQDLDKTVQEAIRLIYQEGIDDFHIADLANTLKVPANLLWVTLNKFERAIAVRRGLIPCKNSLKPETEK